MNKEHLHNKIIKEVIALVASGTYARGERLPAERTLCRRYGVSRGTLRKALATLEKLRVVRIKAGSGVYVENPRLTNVPERFLPPGFDNADLGDIIEARKAIELAAVDQACKRLRRSDLRALESLAEKMETSMDDLPIFLQADMEFHQQLVRASGNVVLVTAFLAIYEYHRFSSVFTSQQEGEERLAQTCHRNLLVALAKKDAQTCRRILAGHLDHMTRYGKTTR